MNYFTDKNKGYRKYHTITKGDIRYSKILFHKVKWKVCDHPEITKLDDCWAESIMQAIIDDSYFDCFGIVMPNKEDANDEDEGKYGWLDWEIVDFWDGGNKK